MPNSSIESSEIPVAGRQLTRSPAARPANLGVDGRHTFVDVERMSPALIQDLFTGRGFCVHQPGHHELIELGAHVHQRVGCPLP